MAICAGINPANNPEPTNIPKAITIIIMLEIPITPDNNAKIPIK